MCRIIYKQTDRQTDRQTDILRRCTHSDRYNIVSGNQKLEMKFCYSFPCLALPLYRMGVRYNEWRCNVNNIHRVFFNLRMRIRRTGSTPLLNASILSCSLLWAVRWQVCSVRDSSRVSSCGRVLKLCILTSWFSLGLLSRLAAVGCEVRLRTLPAQDWCSATKFATFKKQPVKRTGFWQLAPCGLKQTKDT